MREFEKKKWLKEGGKERNEIRKEKGGGRGGGGNLPCPGLTTDSWFLLKFFDGKLNYLFSPLGMTYLEKNLVKKLSRHLKTMSAKF